jgi:dipeptidyl aminopeptidase/acylaminoacyl peptidase
MRSLISFLIAVLCCVAFTLSGASAQPAAIGKRPLAPSDVYRLQTISGLQVSPDGDWIAYVLSSVDSVKDKRNSDIWMVSRDGTQNIQLTNSPEGESQPRFSPDGKYISFVAKRGEDKQSQVYLLDRRGGEGMKATDLKGSLSDYRWSPDGKKLLLVVKDQDFSDTAKTKIRTPYVIDRYRFKQDYAGYLDRRATHLYLFDIAGKKLDTLTTGRFDETQPAFSPDGSQIAFVSNRTEDPDRNANADIYVMDAKPGAALKKLTSWPGTDSFPEWSPDGSRIAYLQSSSSENFTMYGENYLAVISKDGGTPSLLSKPVDRPVGNQRWTADGRTIFAIMRDDRQTPVVSFDAATGRMTREVEGERSFSDLEYDKAHDSWVLQLSTPQRPAEIFALEKGSLRALTNIHDGFLAPLQLASVEGFQSKSKDGTLVSGILYRPANAPVGRKLPLILFIHGGPVGQDQFGFDLSRQMLAAAGYAVAAVNYRGSSGRGIGFTRAIYADWGHKEVVDIVGSTDYLIKQGIVDENRMGIAGWSYGGISSNHTIATDQRFKAAVSGAGSSLQLTMYGTDQYITQYETELGVPWKHPDAWMKVSYSFFHADRIKTPTLFMASQNDFNVPVAGAEQMYQALRSMGVPTELVIYPNQNHGLAVPSYIKDRFERHIKWFDKYLKAGMME